MFKVSSFLIIFTIFSSYLCSGFLEPKGVLYHINLNNFSSNQDVFDFLSGFYTGLSVFNDLSSQEECLSRAFNADNLILLEDLINKVKTLSINSEIGDLIVIIQNSAILSTRFYELKPSCNSLINEYMEVYSRLINNFKNPEYLEKLRNHSISNVGALIDIIQKGVQAIQVFNFFESGKKFGDLISFGLYWELL